MPLVNDRAKVISDFEQLAERWKAETAHHSNPTIILGHPAYKAIIELGQSFGVLDVTRLILERIQRTGEAHWWTALTAITGDNPLTSEEAGNVQAHNQRWLEWGMQRGYLANPETGTPALHLPLGTWTRIVKMSDDVLATYPDEEGS